jgi:hypothetical protein
MSIVTFRRAERKGSHVIITAYSESGAGKTYSLILLGRGLVGPEGRLGLLDTETGRGMIYANLAGGYDYAELTPPFTPERYVEALDAAEEAGIDALIIDSGSHEWEGLGGILEIAGDQDGGLRKWARPKARHKKYVQRLLRSRMHLLISLRAKEKYVQAPDPERPGKELIVSAGYVPIQDKRFIFETTVQLFLPLSGKRGVPVVEKCPEDLKGAFPDGTPINEEMGRAIAGWVAGGTPIDRAYEDLKQHAEDAAGGGAEAFRKFWRALSKAERDRLLPEVGNLESIARTADREAEEENEARQNGHTAFRPTSFSEDTPAAPDHPAQAPAAEPPLARQSAAGDSPKRGGRQTGARNRPEAGAAWSAEDAAEHNARRAAALRTADSGPTPGEEGHPEPAPEDEPALAAAPPEETATPLLLGIGSDPAVWVPFDPSGNIKEWFPVGRERLREMQAANAAGHRFTSFRKANYAALERIKKELPPSWWMNIDEIITAGERSHER